ncbi:6-bladed beta-propeller [candidate division KSB1 bacterium]
MYRILFSFFVVAALFASCGSDNSAPISETIDGVTYIHNKAPKYSSPQEAGFGLQFVGKTGDLYAADENYSLYLPVDIGLDKAGNLYVLDSGNYRVQVFDTQREYSRTFGREGQGPGEFTLPTVLEFDEEENIYISDRQNSRIDILATDGRSAGSLHIENAYRAFKLMKNGTFMIRGSSGGNAEEQDEVLTFPLIKVVTKDGTEVFTGGESVDFGDNATNYDANDIVFTADDEGNIFTSFEYLNRIDIYNPEGILQKVIDRPLNYSTEIQKTTIERGEGYVSISSGDNNDVTNGIAVDSSGRIWALTFDRQILEGEKVSMSMTISNDGGKSTLSREISGNTETVETDMYKLEVFDPEGMLLVEIPLTHFCDRMRIIGNKLFIIDNRRAHAVYEYDIIES